METSTWPSTTTKWCQWWLKTSWRNRGTSSDTSSHTLESELLFLLLKFSLSVYDQRWENAVIDELYHRLFSFFIRYLNGVVSVPEPCSSETSTSTRPCLACCLSGWILEPKCANVRKVGGQWCKWKTHTGTVKYFQCLPDSLLVLFWLY